jgi:6-phospho-beta-glucosidase
MKSINVAIIGAGSSYTPEIIEGLVKEKQFLPVREVKLFDINSNRLEIMAAFCKRYLKKLNHELVITATKTLREALTDVHFVDVQIRVGGNAQRILDEKIPLKYGLIGQETTGPGGMMKAFRTIPVMLEIAKTLEECSPEAWIINYTNPTGLVAQAVNKYTNAKIAGLCSGPLIQKWMLRDALGIAEETIQYDYIGLNHLSYAYNIKINGRPISEQEFNKSTENIWHSLVNPEVARIYKVIPSPYFQYYLNTSKKVKELKNAPFTRGESVQLLETEVYKAYSDLNNSEKPEALAKRGGGGYSEIALEVMKAIFNNSDKTIVVNVPNNGAIQDLPNDAVVEIPCVVNASGIKALPIPEGYKPFWGLIASVKEYEQLAVEAAVTGSRELALKALLAHPLVRDYDIAVPLLDELLAANKDFIPQFFKLQNPK